MSGDGDDHGRPGGPPDAEPPDTGDPIQELSEFGSESSPGFLQRVRVRIDRRLMAGHLVEQAWATPLRVILEYVGAVIGLLSGDDDTRRRPDSKEPQG